MWGWCDTLPIFVALLASPLVAGQEACAPVVRIGDGVDESYEYYFGAEEKLVARNTYSLQLKVVGCLDAGKSTPELEVVGQNVWTVKNRGSEGDVLTLDIYVTPLTPTDHIATLMIQDIPGAKYDVYFDMFALRVRPHTARPTPAVVESNVDFNLGSRRQCSTHADCDVGRYCDKANECYDCAVVDQFWLDFACDAFDSSCCSDDFLERCPADPYRCGGQLLPTPKPTPRPTGSPTLPPTLEPTYDPDQPTPAPGPSCEPVPDWVHPKYGDTCDEYTPGGASAEYACKDKKAMKACCSCNQLCTPEEGWEHPKYGDTCDAYLPGGSSAKFACKDKLAMNACCSCVNGETCELDPDWGHPKYGDTCEDYAEGGKSSKYACDEDVVENCCLCPDGPEALALLKAETCVSDDTWVHPKYKDTCKAYRPGGESHAFACKDSLARTKCCQCPDDKQAEGACEVDYSWAHPQYGDTCMDYTAGGKSAKFACDDDEVMAVCCVCQARQCTDLEVNGLQWHDDGGDKYDCEWYSSKDNRCDKEGNKHMWNGLTANIACCACGGGAVEQDGQGALKHTKVLDGDYILQWSDDPIKRTIQMSLLSPVGMQGWISLGFSQTGLMAGADAVVGWVSESGNFIEDYFFLNQSPSGVTVANRQAVSNAAVFQQDGRVGIRFERPFVPNAGPAIVTNQLSGLIYATGKISQKCVDPFCPHDNNRRGLANLILSASVGNSAKQARANEQKFGEPCHGPADLDCGEGLNCFHEFFADQFAKYNHVYGKCVDVEFLGGSEGGTEVTQVQRVFKNGGGFENMKILPAGFVLMWTINDGAGYNDDTITCALVATRPDHQGWIGVGFSPTGKMAGSDAVIGWSNGGLNTHVGDYFLEEKIDFGVKERNKQGLLNKRVIRANGQVAIAFERPLRPTESTHILAGYTPIIVAAGTLPAGTDAPLSYHRYRAMSEVGLKGGWIVDIKKLNLAKNGELCGFDYPNCANKTYERLSCQPFPGDQVIKGDNGNFRAEGLCGPLGENFVDDLLVYDPNDSIDQYEYDHNIRLTKTPRPMYLYWTMEPDRQVIRYAIVSAWAQSNYVAVGFSATSQMIGAYAVLGWDQGDGDVGVKQYQLKGKQPWNVVENKNQGISNVEVQRVNGHTVLKFERSFSPPEGIDIEDRKAFYLLYAAGPAPQPGEAFGYHRFRATQKMVFDF